MIQVVFRKLRWKHVKIPLMCCSLVQRAYGRCKLNYRDLHRDPFDRMLIAQALSENLVLMTHDAHIVQYPVKILW
jgi:PIN domain nuclease of toxin-antitoxin system